MYYVADVFLPGEQFLALIGLVPVVAGVLALAGQLFSFDRQWTAGLLAGSFVVLTTTIFAVETQHRSNAHRQDQKLISAIIPPRSQTAAGNVSHPGTQLGLLLKTVDCGVAHREKKIKNIKGAGGACQDARRQTGHTIRKKIPPGF